MICLKIDTNHNFRNVLQCFFNSYHPYQMTQIFWPFSKVNSVCPIMHPLFCFTQFTFPDQFPTHSCYNALRLIFPILHNRLTTILRYHSDKTHTSDDLNCYTVKSLVIWAVHLDSVYFVHTKLCTSSRLTFVVLIFLQTPNHCFPVVFKMGNTICHTRKFKHKRRSGIKMGRGSLSNCST